MSDAPSAQPAANQAARDQTPADDPALGAETVDLEALTRAVERLWRRDLERERERLGGRVRPEYER